MRERLIGAAIVIIAVVILVPWLISRAHHPRKVVRVLPVPGVIVRGAGTTTRPAAAGTYPSIAARALAEAEQGASSAKATVAASVPAAVTAQSPEAAPVGSVSTSRFSIGKGISRARRGWTIQVASYARRNTARALAGRLEKLGFPVYLDPNTLRGRIYLRVMIGPYARQADARAVIPRIEKLTGAKVLLRAPPGKR